MNALLPLVLCFSAVGTFGFRIPDGYPAIKVPKVSLTPDVFSDFNDFNADVEAFIQNISKEVETMGKDMFNSVPFDESKVTPITKNETKIVDGHVINTVEKTYTNADGNSIVHFKSIIIKPTATNDTEDVSYNLTSSFSETPNSNTIPKDVELVDTVRLPRNDDIDREVDRLNLDVPNSLQYSENTPDETFVPIDLSKDTAVNDYISQRQQQSGLYEIDPNAEFIPSHSKLENSQPDVEVIPLENSNIPNSNAPRSVPFDLSRDTLVNEYASQKLRESGLTMMDPDVEVIDVNKFKNRYPSKYYYST